MMITDRYDIVIGLEIHVQLNTLSKLFSPAPADFGAEPNANTNPIDFALPGTLPMLNQAAVEKAVIFGLAIDAEINPRSVFDRKHYFYPDSPKGYQTSQFYEPIVKNGHIDIDTKDGKKTIVIERAHLEEDAGKSLHEDYNGMTGIDLNRAGTPLIEIVTAPVMYSASEAVAYMRKIHELVRFLGISDANMQEGSFRCDANVSLKPKGSETLGTRTEIKNLNSFRFIEQAIHHEITRHAEILDTGGKIDQETRLYDPDKDETRSMRGKENAQDYRYFPDPDLAPVVLNDEFIDNLRAKLPELPSAKRERFINTLSLSEDDAILLTQTQTISQFYETIIANVDARFTANRLIAMWLPALNDAELDAEQSPIAATTMTVLLSRIQDGTINDKGAKVVFETLWAGESEVDRIIEAKGLAQVSNPDALKPLIAEIVAANPKQVEQYQSGNEKILGFFVGQLMKKTGGKANPKVLNELLVEMLKET